VWKKFGHVYVTYNCNYSIRNKIVCGGKMRKITLIFLLTALVLAILPFVNSATYVVDNQYHWTCLGKGEKLAHFVCYSDCCITCQKNGYTSPWYNCFGSPCGCSGNTDPLDVEPPVMNITSPNNGLISGSRSIGFLIELNEASDIYYNDTADERRGLRKVCSKCKKFDRTISFNDGPHIITLVAIDSSGNRREDTRKFTIDSKKPRVKSTLPKSRGYTNGTFIVMYDELNLERVKLSYNQGDGYVEVPKIDCPKGLKQECIILVPGLKDGPLTYSFILEDVVNTVKTKEGKVNVDTKVPEITMSPLNSQYTSSVYFNINVTELVAIEYMDTSAVRPKWNRFCSRCDHYYGKKSFSDGPHSLVIRATDPAGNSDQESASFSVV